MAEAELEAPGYPSPPVPLSWPAAQKALKSPGGKEGGRASQGSSALLACFLEDAQVYEQELLWQSSYSMSTLPEGMWKAGTIRNNSCGAQQEAEHTVTSTPESPLSIQHHVSAK